MAIEDELEELSASCRPRCRLLLSRLVRVVLIGLVCIVLSRLVCVALRNVQCCLHFLYPGLFHSPPNSVVVQVGRSLFLKMKEPSLLESDIVQIFV